MKSYENIIIVEMKNQRALRKEIGELKADREDQSDTEKAETEAQILLKEDKKMLNEMLKKFKEKEQDFH